MRAVNMLLDDFFSSYMPSLSSSLRENRLERMRLLLERIGNPERKLRTIHVAGSKGKGTVATCLSYILSSMGERTGLFLSPHVYDIRERFTLASSFFSDEEYMTALEKLKDSISGFVLPQYLGETKPTTFELYTAYGYLLFESTGCRWAVIETGMGGRLDATNTLLPEASVITVIEKEHTQILGDTLEKIAAEKAGIIKPSTPVFVLDQSDNVLSVFRRKAESLSSPLSVFTMEREYEELSSHLRINNEKDDVFTLDALYALFVISKLGFDISSLSLDFTSSSFHLPGRNERRLLSERRLLLDGAHTPASVSLLSRQIEKDEGKKRTLIFSCAVDKDHITMGKELLPLFENVIVTSTGKWKKSDPERIFHDFSLLFPEKNIILIRNHGEAVRAAMEKTEKGSLIVVTGSFYLLSEIDRAITEEGYGD